MVTELFFQGRQILVSVGLSLYWAEYGTGQVRDKFSSPQREADIPAGSSSSAFVLALSSLPSVDRLNMDLSFMNLNVQMSPLVWEVLIAK